MASDFLGRDKVSRALSALVLLTLLAAFFCDGRTLGLLRNTIQLALATCVISLPVGSLLALLVVRTDLPGRGGVAVAIGAMLFVPLYLQAAAWDAGFGQFGWYGASEGSLAEPMLDGWRAAIWIHALAAIPWVALIVGVGLRFVEPELEEEALLDGSFSQVFVQVTLVRCLGSLFAAALWILVTTAGEMTVTDLYGVRTYAEEIYLTFGDNMQLNGLAAITAAGVCGCLILVAFIVASRLAPPQHISALRPLRVFPLGNWREPAAAFTFGIVVLIVGVPLANLCYKAGVGVQQIGDQRIRVWTFEKFLHITTHTPIWYGEYFSWTQLIGFVAATATMFLAIPLAWWARQGGTRAVPAIAVTAVCLAIPGPLIGVGLIWLLNWEQSKLMIWLYDHSILAPTLATLMRALPLAILICWYSLRSVAKDELDSAATEGAGPMTRLVRIAAQQRVLALCAAWLVSVSITSGDLTASLLVIPPGLKTVPPLVFGMVHAGVDDRAAGICLLSVTKFLLIAVCAFVLFRYAKPRKPVDRKHG